MSKVRERERERNGENIFQLFLHENVDFSIYKYIVLGYSVKQGLKSHKLI